MKEVPLRLGDSRERVVVDTVRSILEDKGHDIIWISPHATVYQAIEEMSRREVGALLVLSTKSFGNYLRTRLRTEGDTERAVIQRDAGSRDHDTCADYGNAGPHGG